MSACPDHRPSQSLTRHSAPQLIKQTYSVFIDYPKNSRKWHLSAYLLLAFPRSGSHATPIADAYYTQDSLEALRTVDDIHYLRHIEVPRNRYVCARNNGARRNNARQSCAVEQSIPMMPPLYEVCPSSSTSSSESGSPPYSYSPDSPSHPPIPPVAPLPAGIELSSRQLAPLEYLQNISPRARDPADDEALRQFQWTMSPL